MPCARAPAAVLASRSATRRSRGADTPAASSARRAMRASVGPILPATPSTTMSPPYASHGVDRRVRWLAEQVLELRNVRNRRERVHRLAYYDAVHCPLSVTDPRDERRPTFPPGSISAVRAVGTRPTRDWQQFLTDAPHGALAAVENGRVIGTVATLPYGPFAWISMVLVDPAARRKGIGTLLLDRGLALVPEQVVARLDATPAGEALYRKLGFVAEYRPQAMVSRREPARQPARVGCATDRACRLAGHSRDGRARVRRIAGEPSEATCRRGVGVQAGS